MYYDVVPIMELLYFCRWHRSSKICKVKAQTNLFFFLRKPTNYFYVKSFLNVQFLCYNFIINISITSGYLLSLWNRRERWQESCVQLFVGQVLPFAVGDLEDAVVSTGEEKSIRSYNDILKEVIKNPGYTLNRDMYSVGTVRKLVFRSISHHKFTSLLLKN